jgi:hypothetical protein
MPISNFIIAKMLKKVNMKSNKRPKFLKQSLTKTKTAEDLMQLKDQYYHTYESLKPVNLIKKMLLGSLLLPQNLKEIFLTVLLVLHQDT